MHTFSKIYQIIATIPVGKVTSYGAIAKAVPNSTARVVAYALHACKSEIAWHRVVNSKRKISFEKNSQFYCIQKELLLKEGIKFNKNDEIAIEQFIQ